MSIGLNVPRLTSVERDALVAPTTDLIIFNTDTGTHQTWNGASWVEISAGGSVYDTVEEEGVALPQRTTIDFQGAGVTATDDGANTVVTIPGGGGGGGSFLARFTVGPVALTGASSNIITFLTAEQDSDSMLGTPGDAFLTFQNPGTYVVYFALTMSNQSANNTGQLDFFLNGGLVGRYRLLGFNAGNPAGGTYVAHIDALASDILTLDLSLPFNASGILPESRIFMMKA